MATVVTPATIAGGDNPFPPGKWHLVVVRGLVAGGQLLAHFYAVRHLPLSDVMMLASIKPVSGTLLARLVLKEAVGVAEVVNLVLVVAGLCLVVQPSFVFGDTGQQYDQHMMASVSCHVSRDHVSPRVAGDGGGRGGGQPAVGRPERHHPPPARHALGRARRHHQDLQPGRARGGRSCPRPLLRPRLRAGQVLKLVSYTQYSEGVARWGTLLVGVAGTLDQVLSIFALKVEEAHVITLASNSGSIIVSFLFQLIFFRDFPNTLKIIGLCVVLLSILLLGGQKILKQRKEERLKL